MPEGQSVILSYILAELISFHGDILELETVLLDRPYKEDVKNMLALIEEKKSYLQERLQTINEILNDIPEE